MPGRRQGIGQQLQIPLVTQRQRRIQAQHARRQVCRRQSKLLSNHRQLQARRQPGLRLRCSAHRRPQCQSRRRRGRPKAFQLLPALLLHHHRQLPVGGQWQPTQVHQYRHAVLRTRGLVHLHSGTALAQLVVQQHRAGQELQPVAQPMQGPGRVHRCIQRYRRRTTGRHLRQQHFLLMHALQLPDTKAAEHQRHQQGQQPTEKSRVLSRHDKWARSR
ncbi:hypothetical protein D3C81_537930 [compost metagenome]